MPLAVIQPETETSESSRPSFPPDLNEGSSRKVQEQVAETLAPTNALITPLMTMLHSLQQNHNLPHSPSK
ncbi:hypothetical protein OROGR_000659 [Orobanche gracilis]